MDIIYSQTNAGVYTYAKPRFWKRQFGDAVTKAQFRFDVIFGIILPVLCFVFDPIVFRSSYGMLGHDGIYHSVRLFAYSASALEIATLACWLFLIRKYPVWSRPAGGVLAAGAFFSFALGVAILPLSIIGLIFVGVGALGFIPFITAIVYMRNARRALRLNRTSAPVRGGAAASFVFGLAFALGMPAVAQRGTTLVIRSASARVLAGGELSPQKQRIVRMLTFLSGETFDDLVSEYNFERNEERRTNLAEAYWEITGRDINDRHNENFFDD